MGLELVAAGWRPTGTTSVPLQRPSGRSGRGLTATLSLEPFGWYRIRVINSFGVPLVATQPVPDTLILVPGGPSRGLARRVIGSWKGSELGGLAVVGWCAAGNAVAGARPVSTLPGTSTAIARRAATVAAAAAPRVAR